MRKLITLFLMAAIPIAVYGQIKEIGGQIVNDSGSPVSGAKITEKENPTNTVTSDMEGQFVIKVNDSSKELEVTGPGSPTKTVQINGSYITITLVSKEKMSQIDGITIKGYGSVASKARVRTQSIQSMPETTVALDADQIEANGIDNVQSFTSQISNVTFNQSQQPGVNFLTVRGIPQIRNGESPVAVVIDGMTLPDASIMNMSLYDIQLLEFVKGPQGTLYGKNAIAGAINITTKDPVNANKTKLTLSTGNGGLWGAGLSSSGAITKNKFYYSIVGNYRNFDGLINNTFLNQKADFSKEYSIRAKLKYRFGPRWSATYVQDNFNVKAGANYYVTKTDILNPKIPVLADDDYSQNPSGDVLGDSKLSNSLSSLKVEGSLNKIKLQSVTSFNSTRRYFVGEGDYSSYAMLKQLQNVNSDTFSQEFRLTSVDSKTTKLSYTIGALFQNSKRYLQTENIQNSTYYDGGFTDASVANANYNKVILAGEDNNRIKTLAGFLFLDYKLTKSLTASAGVRMDYDQLTNNSILTNSTLKNDITVWQPKFSLAYAVSKTIMAYANYGRGYRSGGFNSKKTVKFDKMYAPEFTNNYELGLKTSFLNNRIIFNNAFYVIEFENQQQYTFVPFVPVIVGIYNINRTLIKGFESEIKFKATNSLDFFASLGINDGKIKNGTYNRLTDAASFDYDKYEVVNIKGNTSPFTVKYTIQAGANANFAFSENSGVSININVDHRGTQYWDPLEAYKQKPFTLVNTRARFSFNKFGVTVWGKNIFNTKYNQEFFPTDEFGFANVRFPNQPATFGMDVTYSF
ncbi:TonB-dependent receptor [Elizabethkingia anophelis]|uniref:TonB-dependent receptor n=1 Tax=Elizabethkingia anophelis TaxID=1117645 RepID=UPI001625256D|nr:TonB-dependent receptor [Elizabethkingia anophelis]MCT4214556.1 TonB-dependent receptor [Elizabethkingia anophelis]MCT4323377.1 TonB-dependent receptor [Elizabethkingia anophelis]HAY3535757.1 TonB-dependent receptor [Elizabethkingia anophelis]HAY3547974.1 TonB-dependent receptor [Elizabethkingia anophelis]HAY3592783.1 TonB-dependent receptor [Elizabethkingia anophelis]